MPQTVDDFAQFEVSRVRDYNPDTGPSYVLTFAGTAEQITAIVTHYEALGAGAPIGYGYKTNTVVTAAGIIATVRIPDTILYTTRWDFSSEVTQLSMYWFPELRTYLGKGNLDFTTFGGMREWLQEVAKIQLLVNQVRAAQTLLTESAFHTLNNDVKLTNVVHSIVRDGEYREWKRPVIKRCRIIPSGNFAARTRIAGRPLLYSLDGIYNRFGLTDDIYDQAVTAYDGLPAADPESTWAWQLRRDDSDTLVGSGKVQENKDWVFGRYSTIVNTFVE